MKKVMVDAMGDTCPIPVVKTKNAIKALTEPGTVEVYVDNEIAVQNLVKMANLKKYPVSSEKLQDGKYRVEMEIPMAGESAPEDGEATGEAAALETCIPDARRKDFVAVISSNEMGVGEPELGKTLLKAFLYALSQQEELPSAILFYNSGIFLTCEDSPAIEDLKSMEAQGVEILSCGTCLNYYGMTEKLQVGSVTNMYTIVEKMSQAARLVKP